MYLEENFDQSTGPLPLFPVIFPTQPTFHLAEKENLLADFQLDGIWMFAALLRPSSKSGFSQL